MARKVMLWMEVLLRSDVSVVSAYTARGNSMTRKHKYMTPTHCLNRPELAERKRRMQGRKKIRIKQRAHVQIKKKVHHKTRLVQG